MVGVQLIFDLIADRILFGESTAGMKQIVPLGRMNQLVQLRDRLVAKVLVLVLVREGGNGCLVWKVS